MGSITDALKARSAGMKKGKAKGNGTTGPATPAKAESKAKKAPAKKKSKAKSKAKALAKKAEKKTRRAAPTGTPEAVLATERVLNRDKDGDGLRPIERDVIKIVAKGGGTMAIMNIAEKLFGKPAADIPREGVDSMRVVRNAVRKPVEYGLMKWDKKAGRGIVKLLTKNWKESQAAAERYMAKVRKAAATEKAEEPAPKKATKKKASKKAAKAKAKAPAKKATKKASTKKAPAKKKAAKKKAKGKK